MIDNKTISICFVRDVTNNVEVYNFTLGARLRSSRVMTRVMRIMYMTSLLASLFLHSL